MFDVRWVAWVSWSTLLIQTTRQNVQPDGIRIKLFHIRVLHLFHLLVNPEKTTRLSLAARSHRILRIDSNTGFDFRV
jgi:hypothetical protein